MRYLPNQKFKPDFARVHVIFDKKDVVMSIVELETYYHSKDFMIV